MYPQPQAFQAEVPPVNPEWARYWNVHMARACLAAGAMGAVFSLVAGSVALALLTDPLFRGRTLLDASSGAVALIILAMDFALSAGFGLFAALTWKTLRAEHRWGAAALLLVPGVVWLASGSLVMLVPFARGMLASLPVMGAGLIMWAAGSSPLSGNGPEEGGIFQWGLALQVAVPLLMSLLFEALFEGSKVAGIVVIYPAFVLLAVVFLAQAFTAYGLARRRWGPLFRRRAPADVLPPGWEGAARARWGGERRRPVPGAAALAVLAIVFVAASAPAYLALTSPAGLDIVKAEGRYTKGKATYDIQVVNRGGLAADGPIEVWLESARTRVLVGKQDTLEGYGMWEFSGTVLDTNITTSTRLLAVVYFRGEEHDRRSLVPPPSCLIMPMLLPVALAGAALSGARRRRLRGS